MNTLSWSHPPRIIASYDKKGVLRRLLNPDPFGAALLKDNNSPHQSYYEIDKQNDHEDILKRCNFRYMYVRI